MRRSLGLVAGLMVVMVGACDGGEDPLDSIGLRVTSSSGSVVLTLAAIEGGAALAIGVSLDGEPQEPFVVELAADPLVALERTTLTFTAEDYDRPQPVVVTAVDDVDVVDGAARSCCRRQAPTVWSSRSRSRTTMAPRSWASPTA